jgi:hypothetical protein
VALLPRELDSRYLAACGGNAVQRLNALTGDNETFECLLHKAIGSVHPRTGRPS